VRGVMHEAARGMQHTTRRGAGGGELISVAVRAKPGCQRDAMPRARRPVRIPMPQVAAGCVYLRFGADCAIHACLWPRPDGSRLLRRITASAYARALADSNRHSPAQAQSEPNPDAALLGVEL